MRRDQAETLIAQLEAAFNHGLPSDTRGIYIEKLMTLPFATGAKRVDRLITTTKFFPKIAELMRPAEGEVEQQNMPVPDRWLQTPEGQYSCYRAERLAELDEATYWDYIHEPATRARLENEWRHAWSQEERRTA